MGLIQWLQDNPRIVASVICGLLGMLGTSVYVRGIWQGNLKPSGVAWALRTFLCVVSFASQMSAGATLSLALTGTQVACGLVLTLLAFIKGGAGSPHPVEAALIAGAVFICPYFGFATNIALWVIGGVIALDYLATAFSVKNMVKEGSESLFFWLCCFGAATTGVLSVGELNVAVLLAPAASVVNATVMLVVICAVRLVSWRKTSREVLVRKVSAGKHSNVFGGRSWQPRRRRPLAMPSCPHTQKAPSAA